MTLLVSEIFKSIQGESTHSGRICAFVRLSECNLACSWCDTRYAWTQGRVMALNAIVKQVLAFKTRLIEVTGGEPLLQAGTLPLLRRLLKEKKKILLETNGSLSLAGVPKGVHIIMDIKTPSSGVVIPYLPANLSWLKPSDEIKFVVADNKDLAFSGKFIRRHGLDKKHTVLLSPVAGRLSLARVAAWCLKSGLNVRLNVQLHKILWPKQTRGV